MYSLIDHFIPQADVRERHKIIVHSPAPVVLDVACNFDMQSVPLVRAIFWLRAKLLGAKIPRAVSSWGLVADTVGMGWGILADEPGRVFIAGAACQPWQADVIFTPIPPQQFASFTEPD